MLKSTKHHVPFVTAIWLIAVPLIFAFLAGAGAGTVFNGLAGLLGVMFSIFGGPSIVVGLLLMAWVGWNVWRDKGGSKAIHG